jgi:hypothetical protein
MAGQAQSNQQLSEILKHATSLATILEDLKNIENQGTIIVKTAHRGDHGVTLSKVPSNISGGRPKVAVKTAFVLGW